MPSNRDDIKGSALREFLLWLEGEGIELAREPGQFPGPHGEHFDLSLPAVGVLPSTWYPAPAIHALLEHVSRQVPPNQVLDLARRGGRATMDRTLRGVYKTLFRVMATPERYARHAGRLWSAYYRSGHFEVEVIHSGLARSRIHDWGAHHPIICAMNWSAAEVIFETMGCRGVSVQRLSCVADGDADCRFEMNWRPSLTD